MGTINTEIVQKLSARQRLFERWFAVAVMTQPDIALSEYAWIHPGALLDNKVAAFWKEFLKNGGDPDKAALDSGTIQEISEAVSEVSNLNRIDVYAEGIVNSARLLRMARGANDILGAAESEDVSLTTDILAQMTREIEAITISKEKLKGSLEIANDYAEMINSGFDAIPSGITILDEAIGRLQRTQVSVLASRTSVGKTALAWQIARNVAGQKFTVLYISTEMTAVNLWSRAVSGASSVDWRKVISGKLTQGEKTMMLQQSNQLAGIYGDYLLVDDKSYSIDEIHRNIAKYKPDLVIIDHLDELTRPPESRSLVEWLAEVMGRCKFIAKKYNCHVMVVHQINRGAEDRQDKRPMLSDLRNSGDIEQKADAVFIMHRPDLYKEIPETEVAETELWIRKNRMGSRDSVVYLNFHLKEQWFRWKGY